VAEWAGAQPSSPDFIDGFIDRVAKAKVGMGSLLQWVQYIHAAAFAAERGLRDYIALLENGDVTRDHIPDLFGYRFYGTIAETLFKRHQLLGKFSALSHEAIRSEFRKLDQGIIQLRGKDVAATSASLAKPPSGTSGPRVGDKTERVLLQYLFPQARPRVPIRR
jgi:hypothetical protein